MKTLSLFTLVAMLAVAPAAHAATDASEDHSCHAPPAQDASQKTNADDYPLTTCVISGEPLGQMGKPFVYTHKQDGKPDQTVKFCCKMCVGSFKKDPAPALAKIAAAREAKAKAETKIEAAK
ncbi:hypothetical protein Ga0100230_011665 [Opitutaceae bacterium TAV3]|nr:hypothetical protein Ga0100230_011665 [Opitutaceae bacterium TAV3]